MRVDVRLAYELGRRFSVLFSKIIEGVREFELVGNALCGVPTRSAAKRNGTEAVPYKGVRRLEFPDTLR